MKKNGTNRYWAAASSEYPPVVFTLGRKTLPKWNVVIGDDRAQVLWMEHVAGIPSVPAAKVTDDMLRAWMLAYTASPPSIGSTYPRMSRPAPGYGPFRVRDGRLRNLALSILKDN